MLKKSLIVSSALLMASCGSILSGTSSNVAVNAYQNGQLVNGAECILDNKKRQYRVVTPANISIDKSRKDMTAKCEYNGMTSNVTEADSSFNAETLLGILLDWGIISIPVDFISGGAWDYPERIDVNFPSEEK